MVDSETQLESGEQTTRNSRRWGLWLLFAVLALLLCFLRWGGRLLIASDALPARVDAAVILQGSVLGEKARIVGAMQMLRQGVAGRALLSLPKESYWGQSLPPVARAYVEREYGSEVAGRVDFCETGPEVNSTADEARVLSSCIKEHRWQTIAVVTSNYHTRRAGTIWRKMALEYDPPVRLWIYGVDDPEFQPEGWWRERLYAKTWFMEFTKLLWARLFG